MLCTLSKRGRLPSEAVSSLSLEGYKRIFKDLLLGCRGGVWHLPVTGSYSFLDSLGLIVFAARPARPLSAGLTGRLFPQLLIKLKTRTSTEYFLEACSREERDAWAFEITGAIHAGQPGKVQQLHILKNSFKLPPHISLQ